MTCHAQTDFRQCYSAVCGGCGHVPVYPAAPADFGHPAHHQHRAVCHDPDDYDECTKVAKQEQEENARPELTASVENMADYDVIFLGYPIWWSDMPMAVYSFLESYDFSGKTIIPFCTHEGSGISSTESSIAEVCPDTEVLEGLGIRGSIAQNSQDEAKETVDGWLEEIGTFGQE